MTKFYAVIYDTKNDSRVEIGAWSQERLKVDINRLIKGRNHENISIEYYAVDTETGKELARYTYDLKMSDLRNYKETIKEAIKGQNSDDQNWKWSLNGLTKECIKIKWGYLDYCGETKNCFFVRIKESDLGEYMVTIRTPDDEFLNGWLCGGRFTDGTMEDILKRAVRSIGEYARHTY